MIFIIQQILPHYRHDILRYLPEDRFAVLYSDDTKDKSLRSVTPTLRIFHKVGIKKIKGFYIQSVHKLIRSKRPGIIILPPEVKNIGFWKILLLRKIYRFKVIAWTHGINNKDYYTRLSLTTKIRLHMMRLCDEVLLYNEERATAVQKYSKLKLRIAPNTLDTLTLDSVYKKIHNTSKDQIKEKYNVNQKNVFIYVGRLIHDKNIIDCIALFKLILHQNSDSILLIIGAGPEEKRIKDIISAENLENHIRLLGEISNKETLGELLHISTLHIHLGYVGLAVVESMCYGSPIVTLKPTEKGPYHSPEFCYLKNNYNAIITENIEQASVIISELINTPEKLLKLKNAARETYSSQCNMHTFLNTIISIHE